MSAASSGLFATPPPPAAIEISSARVNAVALSTHGSPTITGHSIEPLPPGLVTPALNAVNIHDQAALAGAIKTTLDRLTPRPRRVAVILPDIVGKVSLLRFEKVPAKAQDLEQLVRWQMRKAVPFRIEDAQVSWMGGTGIDGGGREYVVLASRRDIVESYERACEAAGVHAGIVDIASFNTVNAVLGTVPGSASGDWLLVHTALDSATLIVVRDGRVIFYRNRPAEGAAHDMGDLVHQTAMYFEDRLGGGRFARVVLAGASSHGAAADGMRAQIEERLGTRVDLLDVRGAVTLRDRIAAGPELLDAIAPAVGVLLRDRAAASPATRAGERVA
jgi:Type IV pilus assembly protein PilM